MPFEEISLHYRGISPVNTANRKYLCRQGRRCRAGKGGQRPICRRDWTDAGAESKGHGASPLPSSSLGCGDRSTHPLRTFTAQPLHPGSSTPLPPPRPTETPRRRRRPPSTASRGHRDPHGHHEKILVPGPGSKLGRQARARGRRSAVSVFFGFRTICTARAAAERGFLAGAGEVPLQLSAASQTWLARGRAFQNALSSNRKAAERCSSQKSAALVFFLMKANLVFCRSRPELFQTRKTADTNQ